ncbi:MAG: hypothetical protein ACOYVF_06135, partial [Candidatus Zixiibacteriota bacterium]
MSKSKIAIYGSNPDHIEDLREQLEGLSYSAVFLTGSLTDLDKSQIPLPDVCLLEIDQPGQDAVKKFFREKKLPVIYLVPRSQPELLDKFKIKKPY